MSGSRSPDGWPQPEAATLKVLVVDDHEANLNIMELLLSVFGCRPVLAGCGEEAVEHAEAQAFDLIVMDLNMPGMDGDEATRLIRANGASKDAFVVRWTTEFFRFAPGLYDSAAPKPMSISALEDLISEALRRIAYRNIRDTQTAQSSEDGAQTRR